MKYREKKRKVEMQRVKYEKVWKSKEIYRKVW